MLQCSGAVTKGHANVSVMLHIPDNPINSIVEIHKVMERLDQTLLLLPSSRWLRGLSLRDTGQVRMVFEFLNENEEEHLTTVIARAGRQPPGRRTPPAIEVRPEDSWEDVKIIFNPSTGSQQISIGQRRLDVVI